MARPADRGRRAGPHRTCVGCRRVRPQAVLTRVTRAVDGTLRPGRTLPGRGAWLCRGSPDCFERAARQGGFARAFRAPVPITDIDALRVALSVPADGPATDFVPDTPAARD